MSKGTVNKVIILGRLGAAPDIRSLPSGKTVTNIKVATASQWKDRNTGENKEHTEWHLVSFFGKLGEVAGQYLRKGTKVYIEGSLQTKKWQDKNGQYHYTTGIIANELQMLGDPIGKSDAKITDTTSNPTAKPSTSYKTAPRPSYRKDPVYEEPEYEEPEYEEPAYIEEAPF